MLSADGLTVCGVIGDGEIGAGQASTIVAFNADLS